MPRVLSPLSLITAEQAAEVDQLVADARAVRQALVNADAALEAAFAQAAAAAGCRATEAIDLLGDGRKKDRTSVRKPHGIVPASLRRAPGQERRGARPGAPDARPVIARRHPLAEGSILAMQAAQDADTARRAAIDDLHATRNRVNEQLFRLMFPPDRSIQNGYAVDVFDDGTVKALADIALPAGIVLVQHRVAA